jgi:nucleoside-diphosphate-sugar epimerase
MKVFVAGSTGAIGSKLVPRLVARGHAVTGSTRTPERLERVRALGATPVLMDALDEASVDAAVAEAEPDVLVHELTDLPDDFQPKRFAESFARTDLLRTEGTEHLMLAAAASGVNRVVAQSYAGWPYARTGGWVKTERDPLDPDPLPSMRRTLDALRFVEVSVTSGPIDGIALRYGGFYGPGTSVANGGAVVEAVRRRRFPLVGAGGGVWSFVHIDDAAEATALAVEHGSPGIYNVADDEPAAVAEWLPLLAAAIGARRPRHVPAWFARLLIGDVGVMLMTESRGASNTKARLELGWTPRFASWRQGFRVGLGGSDD